MMILSWFTLASLFMFAAAAAAASGANSNSKQFIVDDITRESYPSKSFPGRSHLEKMAGNISRERQEEYGERLIVPSSSKNRRRFRLHRAREGYAFPERNFKLNHQTKIGGRGYSIPHIKDILRKLTTLGLGCYFSLIFFAVGGIYYSVKKHNFNKLKSKFFQKNGGLLLKQYFASHNGDGGTRIFTENDLKNTNDYYQKSHIFPDEREEGRTEHFVSEIITLTKANHQNVVKFLGCCLETESPILVYELASNGTLFEYIHHTDMKSSLPLSTLLKIASESAAALAYLHSAADSSKPMIIHGNVKSSNILLTDCFKAKVSSLRPSRLAPVNESQISTLVQRTLGYLDPEYLRTGQLTDKSDVYSFGVVLLELLTAELPISFNRPENRRVLTSHFYMSMEQNALFEIVAPQLVTEANREKLRAVAEIAKRSLKMSGLERPNMEDVAEELKSLL